jgi:hypothetical protein
MAVRTLANGNWLEACGGYPRKAPDEIHWAHWRGDSIVGRNAEESHVEDTHHGAIRAKGSAH